MNRLLVFAVFVVALLSARVARAETWEAPVGGKSLPLQGRVVCGPATGGWVLDADGRGIRPPATDDAIGRAADVKVAANAVSCATASTLTLVATARFATIDPTTTTLFVDEARLELHGRGLRGAIVRWFSQGHAGEDRCVAPQTDASGEKCSVAVARGLPADPSASDLWQMPAGSRDAPDVVTFDAAARRVDRDAMLLHPARIVVDSLVPPGVAVDLTGGGTARIALAHPDAVASADCGAASCAVSGNVILVGGVSNLSSALAVRMRLAPRVFFRHADTLDATPLVQVPVLPCGMSIASGEVIRDVDRTRLVVRVDARCAADAGTMRWFSAGRALDVLGVTQSAGAAYVLLGVDRVDGDEVVVTATRGGADASSIGQARARTRVLPFPHATLSFGTGETIDFVPTNRDAVVRWAKAQGLGRLVLLPVEGVYDVRTERGDTLLRGQRGAAGFVALRFAWRVPTLPAPFDAADLAIVDDPLQRPIHEGAIAVTLASVVELDCGSGMDERRIAPGDVAHVSFSERDACRVVFHRERLKPDDGAQHLQLEVTVTRVDGEPRPEAHVLESVVLRNGDRPRSRWLKHVAGPFDHVTVRVSHVQGTQAETEKEEPSIQWGVVFGTGHFRLYGTTAIPTGLYRVADSGHSGILSLNLGVLMRVTWLDSEGHEGFLGLEGGVMAEGLANDTDASGHSLTQVAVVTGVGLSVPIANRSLATETSINLHAWFEYEISRDLGSEPGSPFGFVFGPSISIGNVGTNF